MTQPVQLYILAYDPTTSIVGNGVSGQVHANLVNTYSWQLTGQGLPGQASTGIYPNPENTNTIVRNNIAVLWPMRGGLNTRSQLPRARPRTTPVGFSAIGIPMVAPGNQVRVAGARGSVWTVNNIEAAVQGQDQYGGVVDPSGRYIYQDTRFITNNAWANIPGFSTGYVEAGGHSKIIGWAADGYPIYGPLGYITPNNANSPVQRMTSGYVAELRDNRPADPLVDVRSGATRTDQIRVKNPQVCAPGLRLSGGPLPGEVKVLQVQGDYLILDTPVTVTAGLRIQGYWPLGIFVEDWVYQESGATLDKHNGRYCVTPEYPLGTYAYFATQDSQGDPTYPYFVGNTLYGDLAITPPPPPPPLTWVTPGGNLGTLAQNVFFSIQLQATASNQQVSYTVIAGELPDGVQVTSAGLVSGVPTIASSLGFGVDFESKFTVRAYTLNNLGNVDQIRDQTFTIIIAGSSIPDFATPAGSIGSYYDGSPIDPIQLEFTEPLRTAQCRIVAGRLPTGLVLSPRGEISGYIGLQPVVDEPAGYDLTPNSEYGYDFLVRSSSYNYQFTVEVFANKQSNLRTFEIFVTTRNDLTADNTTITADNTIVTADQSNDRIPFLLNPEGSIGTAIDDNFFAYKFNAVDLDEQAVNYNLVIDSGPGFNWSLPPGLSLDPNTGWLYGYIPSQGISKQDYTIALRVGNVSEPGVFSPLYFYSLTVISGIDTRLEWITPADLGTIDNGTASLFQVEARALSGSELQYRLKQGSDSNLPQGLQLLPSGRIAGTVSFNTFALDNGRTTFDRDTTTFDLTCRFTVNTYSPTAQQLNFRISSLTVQSTGSGFTSTPTITIASPDANGEPATVGAITMVNLGIGQGLGVGSVAIDSGGNGYRSAPIVTVTGGGGSGCVITANLTVIDTGFLITSDRTFTIKIRRRYNEPLDTLFVRALAPDTSRQLVENITQDITLIPEADVFRPDDFNFGINKYLYFVQAYGLPASTSDLYQRSLELNHYWKNVVVGPIETARAVDASGAVVYEVIYSRIIDNLVNNQGVSVSKAVTLEIPVTYQDDSTEITTVYPNSLDNMRTQVIDTVGEVANILPLWMTSLQANGQQIGYVPAWIIAYVKPGTSARIRYDIDQRFGSTLNQIDWKIDRYELGRGQSHNWDPIYDSTGGAWVPKPASTTFDVDNHYWPKTSDGSTEIFFGGVGYARGSRILITGASLGGFNQYNDLYITVTAVNSTGTITNFYMTGVPPVTAAVGTEYTGITGTTVLGPGAGANFDVIVQGTANPTTFDGNSLQFVVPVDEYNPGDRYNKYLVFPKRNILE